MSTNESQPHMIFHDFESKPTGSKLTGWPLHFTLTPFFTLKGVSQAEVLALIASIANKRGPFDIEPGELAMYGPNNDIPVTRISDATGELMHLHTSLVRGIGEAGCKFTDLTYALENYSPHVSHKSSFAVPTQTYPVGSISVATKIPGGVGANKVILQNIPLL